MKRNRLHRLAALSALSLALTVSADAQVAPPQLSGAVRGDGRVIRASEFVAALGVNGHVSWPDHYPYSETAKVVSAMRYLGVANLRDFINSSTLPVFERLASSGIRFNLLLNPKVGVDNYFGWVRHLQRTYPGSVASLEGPNEVDNWPVSYAGLTGYPAAIATQKVLYARAKADPALAKLPVYNVTIAGISRSKSDALGDLSAHADYANVHSYYRAGQQSWGYSFLDPRYTLKNYIASARWTAPGRPVVITETGSTTSPGSAIGVTEDVQAKQILNSLMAAAKHEVAATYIYELVDSHDGGPDDIESHYGLFRYDWTPKPAAHALRNLTRILTSGSPRAPYSAPAPTPAPSYSLTGLPPTGSSLLFREDDGSYDIVVWAEPDIWRHADRRAITVPAVPVRVTLDANYASVAVYDPLVSDKPVQVLGETRSVTLPVTDHPLIVELTPFSSSGRGSRDVAR